MKTVIFTVRKPLAALAVALIAAVGLAACGGSETHTYPDTTPAPTPAPAPGPMIDAFFTAVMNFVAASSDATEPASIEAIVATSPENTEPEPLG
jgi:hypothetical protein